MSAPATLRLGLSLLPGFEQSRVSVRRSRCALHTSNVPSPTGTISVEPSSDEEPEDEFVLAPPSPRTYDGLPNWSPAAAICASASRSVRVA